MQQKLIKGWSTSHKRFSSSSPFDSPIVFWFYLSSLRGLPLGEEKEIEELREKHEYAGEDGH